MTITCSACDCPFDPGEELTVVACPFCGHRTFNPYVALDGAWWDDDRDEDDRDEDDDDHAARFAGGLIAQQWQTAIARNDGLSPLLRARLAYDAAGEAWETAQREVESGLHEVSIALNAAAQRAARAGEGRG